MSKAANSLRTYADAAKALGVTTKSIAQWRDNFADFPKRNARGNFSSRQLTAFCRRHSLGPFNPARSEKSRHERTELHEARRLHTIEKAANMAVTNSRLRAEQQRELAQIVMRTDVEELYGQLRRIAEANCEEFAAAVQALVGEQRPTEAEWEAWRERVVREAESLPRKFYERVQRELV